MEGTLLQGSGMRHKGICLNMEKHKQECRSLYVHQCPCACPCCACVLTVLVIRGLVTGLLWQ